MQHIELPTDYALVLQHVRESGEEDLTNLGETLRFDRKRLLHIIRSLQHKGLIKVSTEAGRDAWISLSAKGYRAMTTLWPETGMPYAR